MEFCQGRVIVLSMLTRMGMSKCGFDIWILTRLGNEFGDYDGHLGALLWSTVKDI